MTPPGYSALAVRVREALSQLYLLQPSSLAAFLRAASSLAAASTGPMSATATASPFGPHRAGPLEKHQDGLLHNRWTDRFFVLRPSDALLEYYAAEPAPMVGAVGSGDAKPAGSLWLRTRSGLPCLAVEQRGREVVLCLAKRVVRLRAPSAEGAAEWAQALTRATGLRRDGAAAATARALAEDREQDRPRLAAAFGELDARAAEQVRVLPLPLPLRLLRPLRPLRLLRLPLPLHLPLPLPLLTGAPAHRRRCRHRTRRSSRRCRASWGC